VPSGRPAARAKLRDQQLPDASGETWRTWSDGKRLQKIRRASMPDGKLFEAVRFSLSKTPAPIRYPVYALTFPVSASEWRLRFAPYVRDRCVSQSGGTKACPRLSRCAGMAMQHTPLDGCNSFDPEAFKILTRAFDEAWPAVARHCHHYLNMQANRERLACIILDLAREGRARRRDAEVSGAAKVQPTGRREIAASAYFFMQVLVWSFHFMSGFFSHSDCVVAGVWV
jgi:hypothetical protein